MKHLMLIALALCVGCGTFAMHAESDGALDFDSDTTYFAVAAKGEAQVRIFKDGKLWKQFPIDAGESRAWKRSGWNPFKGENWEKVDYDEAMRAIHPPDGVRPEPAPEPE